MSNFEGIQSYVNASYLARVGEILDPLKNLSYDRLSIGSGSRLLDIGCGLGADVRALAGLAGTSGIAVGCDLDFDILKQAHAASENLPSTSTCCFVQSDASLLSFPGNFFDGCRSERLLMHLDHPERALTEMIRVIKPGGCLVVIETDWRSLSVDTSLPAIEHALSEFRVTRVLRNGYSGRSLYRLFRHLPLVDLRVEVYPLCVTDIHLFNFLTMQNAIEEQALAEHWITVQQLEAWRDAMQQAADTDCFYASANMVMVSAKKPAQE
ncbi:MAG: methyltransferase domain-containing protein [Gammaproteobacteria bacterium]